MTITSEETFKKAANKLKQDDPGGSSQKSSSGRVNIPKYLDHYGISYKIKQNGVGIIYALEQCPFDSAHVRESSIIKQPTGMLTFQCFHNSCKGHTWKEARAIISGDDSLAQFMDSGDDTETAEPTTDKPWDDPIPLNDNLPPVQKLDPAMIPEPIRPWLMDISERMQLPPDFPVVAAIVAAGSVIGRNCGIYPKKHDDWLLVPNIWGADIGNASAMKSPSSKEAQKPLSRLEAEAHAAYEEAMQSFEVEYEAAEIKRSAVKDRMKKAAKNADADSSEHLKEDLRNALPKKPTRTRFQTQDGTIEKIGEILKENPKGLLVNRDELTGWLRTLDKPGRDGDRAFYLESWNGDRRFTYDRIGRGTLDIPALCLSVFGNATPGGLIDYIKAAVAGGTGDDGLMQRFQMMVWPDAQNTWHNVDRFPNTEAKNRAWEIFKKLSQLDLKKQRDAFGTFGTNSMEGCRKFDFNKDKDIPFDHDDDIPALRFSDEGQIVFDQWRHDLEIRMRGDHGLPPALESHLIKYRKLMPALALIFHLIDYVDGQTQSLYVSEKSALMAAAWCDYLETHAKRVYGVAHMQTGTDAAKELLGHIRAGDVKDGATIREIWRHHWSLLTNADEVKVGLNLLQQYGWLIVEKLSSGGRPTELIKLHPKLKKIVMPTKTSAKSAERSK